MIPRLLQICLGLLLCLHVRANFAQLGPVTTLDNGNVKLDVALRVGRIVSFHRHGEPDWLVVHDEVPIHGWNWNPWGGDRMWPTSQSLNYQIYGNNGFDPVIDGKPWALISKTSTSLEMRSGISPELGLQVTRRIELVGQTTEVLHTYRVERVAKSNFPIHVWTVTGVRAGDFMLMESDTRIPHESSKPYKSWIGQGYTNKPAAALLPDTRILQVQHLSNDESQKIGTYGRWVAVIDGPTAFVQISDYHPDQLYIDACNLEVFTSNKLATHELETLSPTWFLTKGETREWTVRWRLLDFPTATEPALAIASYLNQRANR
jgi:hypothetical protein